MELGVNWNQLVVVIGLLASLSKALPMDIDSIKDGIQMGAMTGMAMAMDAAENIKGQAKVEEEIDVGPMHFKKSVGGSFGKVEENDSSEEDRKRRRRSVDEQANPLGEYRQKRSPCFPRRRARTTAAPTPAGGGAGAGDVDDDLPRRRKRSPDDDDNNDILPDQKTLADRTQAISEKLTQMMKSLLETVAGAFENLKKSIKNATRGSGERK